MQLRPERLEDQLRQQVLPVYFVSGDEPLQVQEACDAIRAAARRAGCTEREVMQVERGFNWDRLIASGAEMSLFADRKLIELRIPSGKPGTEGSRAFAEYLGFPTDNVLLIVAGKIDRAATNSKWFKALDRAGAVLRIWPVEARDLPRWLRQRLTRAGMEIDRDALALLGDRVEGNLPAAAQEIEKLKLLCEGERITEENVGAGVADNARYNPFVLADRALRGDAAHALKILHGLRSEGSEAAVVLWALTRELRLLYQCRADIDRGENRNRAFQARRVLDRRKPLVSAGLSRHSRDDLAELLHRANIADRSIKGLANGDPWDHLARLTLDLSRGRGNPPAGRA